MKVYTKQEIGIVTGMSFYDYDTQYGGEKGRINSCFWDSKPFISGQTSRLRFFDGVRESFAEGNMQICGMLPAPCALFVRGINVRLLLGANAAANAATESKQRVASEYWKDFDNIVLTGAAQLTIALKPYGQWPLSMLVMGSGFRYIEKRSRRKSPKKSAKRSVPNLNHGYRFSVPLFIAPNVPFVFDIMWKSPIELVIAEPVIIIVAFEGDLVLPIS